MCTRLGWGELLGKRLRLFEVLLKHARERGAKCLTRKAPAQAVADLSRARRPTVMAVKQKLALQNLQKTVLHPTARCFVEGSSHQHLQHHPHHRGKPADSQTQRQTQKQARKWTRNKDGGSSPARVQEAVRAQEDSAHVAHEHTSNLGLGPSWH